MKANRFALRVVTVLLLLSVSPAAFGQGDERGRLGKTAGRILHELEQIDSLSRAHEYLQTTRPACIAAAVRAQVIARLPYVGGVEADRNGRLKLEAIESVLRYHERKGVFEVRVIRVVQAFIGLHARSVLLISERALHLLTAAELRAAVAHEMGHEYFWDQYQAARRSSDPGKLQEVELRCDAIAVLTLLQLHADPADLLAGVSKQAGFNKLAGATANENCYVSLKDRTRFVRVLIGRVVTGSARASLLAHSDSEDRPHPTASATP